MYKLTIFGKENATKALYNLIKNDKDDEDVIWSISSINQIDHYSDHFIWYGYNKEFVDERIGSRYYINKLPDEDIVFIVEDGDIYFDHDGDIITQRCENIPEDLEILINKINDSVFYPSVLFKYEEYIEEESKSYNKLLTFCGLGISAGLALWLYNKK